MIELDVDMGYLLEDGEPDCVTLNDENGEFEPMTFYRGDTCKPMPDGTCPSCGEGVARAWATVKLFDGTVELRPTRFYNYCPGCGRKVVDA